MNEDASISTQQLDDVQPSGQTEQELLDAVMASSQFMQGDDVPLPVEEEVEEVDPVESEEEEPAEEEAETEAEEEVEAEEEEEELADDGEEPSTQDSSAYSLDELDDFQVMVKVDGEELSVPIADLVKGYATEQSLSKKGRELGEARKTLDAEREEKFKELQTVSDTANAVLSLQTNALAKEYHELEEKIQKARDDGDTYELGELKDKRETVQKQYWAVKNKNDELAQAVQKQKQEADQAAWKEKMDYFQQEIPNLIPGFDETVAGNLRSFALDYGFSEEFIDNIIDPVAVKLLYDQMQAREKSTKGAAKRKAVPAKKAVPTKKAKAPAKKKQDREAMVKARAFKEDASNEDQMAFLRQRASQSLSNL